jgi:phage-related protein
MGEMIFNGVSTEEMGVVIQTPPPYEFPPKDYIVTHVEGKSGDILIDKGSYQNVKRTYYLASVFGKDTNFVYNANKLVNWLTSVKGYARLEDSYEPEYFRMAMFRNPGAMVNMFDRATTLRVTFECKPQRYLKIGEEETEISSLDSYVQIINPTEQIALPEIVVEGSSDISINFYSGEDYNDPEKSSRVDISFVGEGTIDSEMQDVFNDSGFLNSDVTLENGFPKLYPGTNWIKVTGTTLTTFKIKPKWWTL